MDIATLTQAPKELILAGHPFKVRALKAREWGELHQWLKDHAEDPVTATVRQIARTKSAQAPLTLEQEDYLLSEARKEAKAWPPRASSTAWFELLGNTEGGDVQFLLAVIKTGLPAYTENDARHLGEMLGAEESSSLMLVAMGIDPAPKAMTPLPAIGKRRHPTKTTGRGRSTG